MDKLIINTSKYCHILSKEEIIFCEVKNGLVRIYLLDNEVICIRLTLMEIFKDLGEESFMFPHRSFIINMKHVKSLHTHRNCYAEMNGDFSIPVSKKRLKQLRKRINNTHQVCI